uniref:Uncharacterized protein LOC100183534 n=1 Tax=Phallusia mammillata TaxID=59560 RepID=A0A6F9DI39_9ASCI|nr:uncharacterized protein LOC100183534 [Phallusia mammillata]
MEHLDLYDYVSQPALDNVAKYLSLAKQRMDKFDQKYSYRDSLPIACIPFITDPVPTCLHVATVQGGPFLHVPTNGQNIPDNKFYKKNSETRKSLTEDIEIIKFISKWKPDIVICLSSLNTIASNLPPHKSEWELPMVAKEYPDNDGGKRHVLFIDKALPSKSLNGREMNEIYFKQAVKQLLKSWRKKSEEVSKNGDQTPANVTSSTAAPSPNNHENVQATLDLSQDTSSEPSNTSVNLPVVETLNTKPGNRSPSEFSHSSDETITKQDKGDEERIPSVLSGAPENNSDSDIDLVIDDVMSDASIPQVDGSNDRKSKKPRKITRSTKISDSEEIEHSETEKEQPLKVQIKEEENTGLKSDVWQRSFSGNEKVTSFLSLPSKPKRPSISSLSMTLWKNKASEIKDVEAVQGIGDEDPLILITDDEEGKNNEAGLNTSQESITYNASCDPVFESQIKAVVSSTRAEHNASPVFTPKRRTRSTAKGAATPKSPPPSTRATRKRKQDSRNIEKSKAAEETRKPINKAKRARLEKNPDKDDEKDLDSSDDGISLSELSQKLTAGSTSPVKAKPTPKRKQLRPQNASSFPNPSAANLITSKPITTMRAKHPKNVKQNLPNPKSHDKTVVSETPEKGESVTSDILGQILGMQNTVNELKAKVRQQSVETMSELQKVQESCQDESLESDGGKSCFYSLWSFGGKRILIRGTHHGYITVHHKKAPVKSRVAIRTKLEYQANLGFEQLTTQDACKEWVDLYFRPPPVALLRCRVDPLKSKVVGTDVVKNLTALRTYFPATGFNDFKAKKLLTETFNRLSNPAAYPPGSYLLSHKSESADFIVRKGGAPEKAVIYDLQREYATPGRRVFVTVKTVPYIPLDPDKQLPAHVKSKRLPMTFEPAPDLPGSKNEGAKKKKNKGKKNKKSRRSQETVESGV